MNKTRKDMISEIDKAEQTRDDVTILIEEKLQKMPPIFPECSIYRVPKLLMEMNHIAYVPQVITIGPFHHDQTVFKATEELKLRLFNSYRCRIDMDIQGIVKKVRKWEKRARRYYSEFIDIDNDEFVKMMVLDGCFIVEFLITDYGNFPETENMVNSSFYEAIFFAICRDLTMLQNQLPFFVLKGLFDQVSQSPENSVSFEQVVHEFLNGRVVPSVHEQHRPYNMSNIKPRHLVDFLSLYFVPFGSENFVHQSTYLPPTATELREAGVVLKKAEKEEERHIMDISFKDGVLKIPPFVIDDCFETYVRNLLAFEQFTMEHSAKEDENSGEEINEENKEESDKETDLAIDKESDNEINEENTKEENDVAKSDKEESGQEINEKGDKESDEASDVEIDEEGSKEKNNKYAIHYFEFLDELITTEKDVHLLVKEGIIINSIGGSDEEITKLFNDLCKNATTPQFNYFGHISKDLKDHCERRRNRWMASLKHNYFNTPWALISFLAATFLILLTLLQTILSIVSISK